ncbi:MAG: hypothetical protein ABRQ38_02150 [Candidatus Eremiobacterota bacterium]
MAGNEQKSGGQKGGMPVPFIMSQLKPSGTTSGSGASWHMSQLKKNVSFAATESPLEGLTKRDGSDSFQVAAEKEEPGFEHADDGLQQKMDADSMGIDGEEEFVDREKEEDDENWESEEDYFQELSERNALLEEALRERIQSPFPPVYNQIVTLTEALVSGKSTLKPPVYYVDEIDSYIQKKIKIFSALPKVDNISITRSNQLMLDGFNLLIEVCNGFRKYIDSPAPYHIELIRQLTKQANEFFSEGKSLLLSVKIEEEK